MSNIIKIFNRLTLKLVKSRTLPFFISVQNIILAFIVLIYVNVIISNGRLNGELNYSQIRFFYNFIFGIIFLLVVIFSPYFLSGELNGLLKNNTIEYLLSSRIKLADITFAVFLRGFFNVMILLISSFPIACVSLYFGGVGILRVVKIIIILFCFTLFFSSFCLFLSSMIKDINVATLFSYVLGIVFYIFHLFFIRYLINVNIALLLYIIFTIFISLVLLRQCEKGRIFG